MKAENRQRLVMGSLTAAVLLAVGCAVRPPPATRTDVVVGFEPNTFVALDAALERAVARNEVPGAVLAIGRHGAVVFERAVGFSDVASPGRPEPMRADTLFDVASLTKPVVTAASAAMLACDGTLDPNTVVYRDSIDAHLRHATAMPPYMDWRDIAEVRAAEGLDPAQAIARVLDADRDGPRLYRPTGYSNLGYVLAGAAIERAAATDMESLLRQRIWVPLGMTRTTFRPVAGAHAVARTTKDVDPGKPFDPLAAYWLASWPGHVPGHSGLFSTAGDLTRFAQALLHPERTNVEEMTCVADYLVRDRAPVMLYRPPERAAFSTPPGRTVAFDADLTVPRSPALYQTGYTGTMIWLHPESGTSVVLLTNSVLYDAEGWHALRREVLRTMRRGLGE